MWKKNEGSILTTGVPVARGRPVHIERDDNLAQCDFDQKTGQVIAIQTPPDAFRRAHELMHARHSDPKRMKRQYKGTDDIVWNIVEDCRIHCNHWLWRPFVTPKSVRASAEAHMTDELANAEKTMAEDPKKRGTWPDFALRLRQVAIKCGLDGNIYSHLGNAEFATPRQRDLADTVLKLVRSGKEGKAAKLLQTVFGAPPPLLLPGWGKEAGDKIPAKNGVGDGQPLMEIIELPHTEAIPEASRGYRRATSGSRLHRPSLRKPVLPQRLFVRKTPREVGGTILVDASGSMGDWNQVKKWCEVAPFGTIAYYAGNGRRGWLYVYARNGKRSPEIKEPENRGNTVDGPAITWLLTQAKPRIMITDRGFCDVADSEAQVARLELLERAGEIKVLDYAHNDE